MPVPDGFLFSQSSLQDFVDCQRRFQLRYLHHLAWPAVEAEPYLENERRMDQGAAFHRIVRQYLVGIPEAEISHSIGADEAMQTWWRNFLTSVKSGSLHPLLEDGCQLFEELTLSVAIGKFRLIAKYDLLVIHPDDKLTIIDWKTSQNRPKRAWLANRLQTHIYPFVLTGALPGLLNGRKADPARLEMVYWFANLPETPERFAYSLKDYKEDNRTLTRLVETINQKSEPVFPLTPDVRRCLFCTYRSLCNRGVKPGDVQQLEEWQEQASVEDISLDFDQIVEIEL